MFKNPSEIYAQIEETCGTHGDFSRLTLFCSQDMPDRILCSVEMDDPNAAEAAAESIKGYVFATKTVTVLLDISPEFDCPMRSEGETKKTHCNLCQH